MVTIRPKFVSLVREAVEHEHIGIVIITCGLRCVWAIAIEREGVSKSVEVIIRGYIIDSFVVPAEVKAILVTRL